MNFIVSSPKPFLSKYEVIITILKRVFEIIRSTSSSDAHSRPYKANLVLLQGLIVSFKKS